MTNQNNQNNNPEPPQMPMMPPPMPPRGQWMNGRMGERMNGGWKMKNVFPKWVTQYGVVVYLLAFAVVSFMYSAHSMPWYYMLAGLVSVGLMFLYGSNITSNLSIVKLRREKVFEQRIFWVAFALRVVWMILIYAIFMQNYGDAFGFENADALYYDALGQHVSKLIRDGNFHFFEEIKKFSGHDDIADMGYGIYVGFVYALTGSEGMSTSYGIGGDSLSIMTVRLLKCAWSTFTVVLIYRLAKRNFDEQTARVAAIICALWPNFWYYSGCHLKETEMTFLAVLFVEQADQMLRSRQFTAWKVAPVLLIGASIFTFRTPLALVAFLALLFSVVMSSSRVVNWGKRIIVGLLAFLLIGVTMGNRIEEQSKELIEKARGQSQEKNMEWRSRREHGNAFAKYAGKSVFAPLIFTIPFPTMVKPFDGQDQQQLLNGGNFIKNIISGFTIFAMLMLLISGKWRDHLLPLSFMLGYLVVLTMSEFAQSERFHQPVMPIEFMFAAYGLSMALTKAKYKRWFMYWCGLMFVACIAWNWFKLAGRGLA